MKKYFYYSIILCLLMAFGANDLSSKPVQRRKPFYYGGTIVEDSVKNTHYGNVKGRWDHTEFWYDDETGEEWDVMVFTDSDQKPWPGKGYIEIRGGQKSWYEGDPPTRRIFASFQTNTKDENEGIMISSQSGYIKILISADDKNIQSKIYNLNGIEFYSASFSGQDEIELPVFQLQSGLYLITVENSEMRTSKKVLITN